ncbi:MFS transporter [Lactiplantibacillus modestisalitolerans]|uniref:MFS transporter n=1 Tax=Lactiplantibacillus modestisalitolerans TaxID=1457219 RepID=A0ABV5WWZ6_9LACO|nr:MFS transporter [Lactiplantibacillus modestisalitolerans]
MQPYAFKTTASILSLSAVSNASTLITGIIPQLQRAYPKVPTTVIESLVTIANLSALVTLLINPWLTAHWGVRRTVIASLLLSAATGLVPAISTNFGLIMVSRVLLGLGIGGFSPHAISLITHFFHGDYRARLLGYQTGLAALGNAVLLGLAGLLVTLSWHAVFWLYALLAGVAGLVARYVAEPPVSPTAAQPGTRRRASLPRRQRLLVLLTFGTYVLIWGVQLKLPSYFAERHLGPAQLLNFTLAAMNIGGFLAGLSFGALHRKMARQTLTLGYAGAAVAVAVLWWTTSTPLAVSAAIGFNWIYSYTGPYLVFTSHVGLAPAQINTLSSTLTIATILSAFCAPLLWNWLGHFGGASLTTNVLFWIMTSLSLLAILSLILNRKQAKSK